VTDAEQLEAEVEVRAWVQRANCNGIDAELFFPDRGEPTRDAKAVCAGCEVREECLDYALETGQKFGIWGGTSERERRALRRMRRTSEA
jgi:WhiB family transcriptional regulator, redox-sensing transcriptional regulator